MAGDNHSGRTAREALAAELLGDADNLLTRMEQGLERMSALEKQLPAVVEQSTLHIRKEREESTAAFRKLVQDTRIALDNDTTKVMQANHVLAQQMQKTVAAFRAESRRLFLRTLLVGAIGGTIAVAIFAALFMILLP